MYKKIKVLFASVLKPVDDVRTYKKLAKSLSKTNRHEISIAGFTSQAIPQNSEIKFYPLFAFPRLSWRRLVAPWQILKIAHQVKPQLLIVNTSELLIVSILIRILFGSKIYYDVQENQYLNTLAGHTFSPWLSKLMAMTVRGIEYSTAPFISGFILAEQTYVTECSFVRRPWIVLENKTLKPAEDEEINRSGTHKPLRLLFGGTVSEMYGVKDAISLAESINAHQEVKLLIIGHCPSPQLKRELEHLAAIKPFIDLELSITPLPHDRLTTAIKQADFGLIAYRHDPSIENCIPTKLYEYLAYQLPILSRPNPVWDALIQQWQAGISIDFKQAPTSKLLDLLPKPFYPSKPIGIFWDDYEAELHAFFS